MSWFRLDDQGAFHAKVLLAGNEAYGAWCRAGQWASAQRTDGVVPEQVARQIAPARVWQKLIAAGMIEPRNAPTDPYVIHDFLEYNPSRSEVEERRTSRQEAGKLGGKRSGEVRRGKQDASGLLPESGEIAKQDADENRTPSRSRPDPVPSHEDPDGEASQASPTSRSPEAMRSSQLTGPTMPTVSPTLPEKAPEAQKAPAPQPPPSKPVQGTLFEQEQAKATKVKKGPSAATRYREAFASGVQDATGRPFAAPPVKGPEDVLMVALRTHARNGDELIRGDDLIAWLRYHVAMWAKQSNAPEQFPYHKFVEWLNSGGHKQAQAKPIVSTPKYVPLPAPIAPPVQSSATEDFLARVKAHKSTARAPIARVPS